MQCIHCGFTNSPQQRFCGNCGTSLIAELACVSCGFGNAPTQNFCGGCGADMRQQLKAIEAVDTPERRYLTVMFCDLVGSTALSERLDPEELSEIILTYREIVAGAVERFGGHIARYIGDGVLIYFGYPRAHGDDPSRALHSALATVAGVRQIEKPLLEEHAIKLAVRIGIHTGLAIVGEIARGAVREESGVVGETPNLASRLTDLAAPNSIVVSGVTRALIRNDFQCRAIGINHLKGLSRPVDVYEVVGPRPRGSKVEDDDAMNATRLTGRDRELLFLRDRWRQVIDGVGQVVSIVGEPGIGKSRLIRAFDDSLAGTDHLRTILYCSPHFSNSALAPVIDHLNRWLDKAHGDGLDPLDRLAEAVSTVNMAPADIVPILASLLSRPIREPYQAPQSSAKIQRELTMEFLLHWTIRQSAHRPALIVIEDLHWADASTLELLRLMLDQIHTAKILLLLTFRPDFHPSWPLHSYLSHLPLDRLTPTEVQEMIQHVAGGRRLPDFVRDQLVEKTDGVPLFIEELTKAVVESDALIDTEDGYRLRGSPIELDIPISLHATLMARLDSLNAAKIVAQRASVIGREFSYELIAAITNLPPAELDYGLTQLVAAELLFQRGLPPRANYIFKHSMIQETAYRSLLRASRTLYHRQIAEVLLADFPRVADTQPELVAHHFTAAHMPIEAAGYWRKAGERALARSASVEALAHINTGLTELADCPKSAARFKEEVMLLTALGAALTASKGYAAPEVAQTYARARDICHELDPSHVFPVLRGLHSYYMVHGPLRIAAEMVEQLRTMADQSGDTLQRVEAHRRLGWCLFCMGRLEPGRAYLTRAIEEYDRAHSSQHIVVYGSDARVIGLVNLAWLEWFAGRVDDAKRYSVEAISLARELSHGLSLAYALGMSAALHQCLGDAPTTTSLAKETMNLAEKQGYPYWVAWETTLLGWARAVDGDLPGARDMLQKGLAAYRLTGAELFVPYILGLLAQTSLRAGAFDEGLDCCDKGLASALLTDVHFFDAELLRLKGECQLGQRDNRAAAEASFERAVAVAREQGARMLELRGLIALTSIRLGAGKGSTVLAPLSAAIKGFEKGSDFPDLESARRLLQQCEQA